MGVSAAERAPLGKGVRFPPERAQTSPRTHQLTPLVPVLPFSQARVPLMDVFFVRLCPDGGSYRAQKLEAG